jgi:hypothetical protein
MDNERKSDQRSSHDAEEREWRPRCTYCKCGHTIVYYLKPPSECPYCNAKLLPDESVCRRLDFS